MHSMLYSLNISIHVYYTYKTILSFKYLDPDWVRGWRLNVKIIVVNGQKFPWISEKEFWPKTFTNFGQYLLGVYESGKIGQMSHLIYASHMNHRGDWLLIWLIWHGEFPR